MRIEYKLQEWNGGKVWVEEAYPNILFAKDGEIYDIAGMKTIVIGGAYSVDKFYRLSKGYNWFEDEQELLISEKAFAYKMKYEALKRQGKRSDLTSCQVGKKLAAEEVSQNTGDSSRQILRYIHLTELITELLGKRSIPLKCMQTGLNSLVQKWLTDHRFQKMRKGS